MRLVKKDFESVFSSVHNAGFTRTSVGSMDIEVFSDFVKLRASTCHYFAGGKHMHLRSDFLQCAKPQKVFKIKVKEYAHEGTTILTLQGEVGGVVKFVAVDEGDGCGCEVKLVDLMTKDGFF